MKNKAILGLIAAATVGAAVSTPMLYHQGDNNNNHFRDNILLMNNRGVSKTNEAVVINGNNSLVLYGLSNGKGIVSYLSTGEMLTILNNSNGYYKVRVHETGAIGYIAQANAKVIFNCENSELTSLRGNGSIINVSSSVNLRAKAGINSSVVGKLHNGQDITLLGQQGQWYKVSVNGEVGYIYGEYISTSESGTLSSESASNVGTSSGSSALNNVTLSGGNSVTPNNSSSSSIVNNINTGSKSNISNNKIVNTKNSQSSGSNKSNETGTTKDGNNSNSNINNNTGNKSTGAKNQGANSVINKEAYVTNIKPNGQPVLVVPIGKGVNTRWNVENGESVAILGENSDSYKVMIGGQTGYINKQYITFNNNQNQIHPNDNAIVSKYFGTWTVGKQIGNTIGGDSSSKSYEGQKVIMTPSLYSFNGVTIKNPNYYIVNMDPGVYFGNSQYNNISNVQMNKYGELELIVVVPSSQKITNYDFINKLMCNEKNTIIASGNNLVTTGGGQYNTNINQCVRGNIKLTDQGNKSGSQTSNINNNGKSNSENGSIRWIEHIYPTGTPYNEIQSINLKDVVVRDTTGENISDKQLAQFMRKWILEGQNTSYGIYGYESTEWEPQWLNMVSDSNLVKAFIEANGENSLKNNITANEFNKATMKLLAIVQQYPEPFTFAQATKLIHEILPDTKITKIVPKQGCYYVYSKQSGSNIDVVVNAYTGYSHM